MKLTAPLTLSCLALLTPLATQANTFANLGSGPVVYTITAQLPINSITYFEYMNVYMGKWQQGRCQNLTLAGQQTPIQDTQNPSSITNNTFTYDVHADAIQNIESNIYNPPTISPLCVRYELCANGRCYQTPTLIATLSKSGYRFNTTTPRYHFSLLQN
jgi:hypothetical protein